MPRWHDVRRQYCDARILWPYSDVAHFALVDASHFRPDGEWSDELEHAGAPLARQYNLALVKERAFTGVVVPIATGGDGGWKVAVRLHDREPADLPNGNASILCPLASASGRVLVHDLGYAGSDDECTHEDHVLEIPPGEYVARVLLTSFEDAESFDEDDKEARVPDYLVDLWPRATDSERQWHWERLG